MRGNFRGALDILVFGAAALALLGFGGDALGEEDILDLFNSEESEPPPMFELHGEFSGWWYWRNDSDFESTIPAYGAEGQSVGQASTFFKPQLTFRTTEKIELFYEAELGLNVWSRNDPDQYFASADNYMIMKHRELWANIDMDLAQLRAGYQRLRDPSDLFLSHWAGAAVLTLGFPALKLKFMGGQLPDDTFEGVSVSENNFVHDNVIAGFEFAMDLHEGTWGVRAGGYGMFDHRIVRRPLTLFTPYLGGFWKSEKVDLDLYGLLQAGSWEDSGVAQIDQSVLAWAASASMLLKTKHLDIRLAGFALSGDDDHDGNRNMGAFFYSGKNSSRTLMITEDELRDRGNNFDEAYSGRWGSFFVNRAGLSVSEVSLRGHFKGLEWFRPELVVGAGFTLNPQNSFGHRYLGLEGDLIVRIQMVEKADLVMAGQLFFPGKASAAFMHTTGPDGVEERTLQMHGFQIGTQIIF